MGYRKTHDLAVEELHRLLRVDGGRLLWKESKGRAAAGNECGYLCQSNGRWLIGIHGRRYLRSRVIFAMTHGRWPALEVDHIDRNPLNDNPNNLREATSSENKANRMTVPRPSGLPRGVYRNGRRFTAQVKWGRKARHIGSFATAEQASTAYEASRKAAFGEFA